MELKTALKMARDLSKTPANEWADVEDYKAWTMVVVLIGASYQVATEHRMFFVNNKVIAIYKNGKRIKKGRR